MNLHLIGMWIGFAAAAFLVAMFSAKISELLREREASLLHMQEELAKKDRLASLVTLAAGAAHELGTPLGTIALVARELERYSTITSPIPAVAEDSRLIRTEVDRCRAILERLSIEGAEPAGEALTSTSVEELLGVVRARFNGVAIDADPGLPPLVIPRHAVEQALIALIKNAIEASPQDAQVVLKVARIADAVQFIVTDRGHGMSSETLRHVGEPFFTTKTPGKGMGLGTFLVRTLAERLGGSLRYESVEGQGTTAYFELPVHVSSGVAV
jgi:two-component system sensor histidine kinase RegB